MDHSKSAEKGRSEYHARGILDPFMFSFYTITTFRSLHVHLIRFISHVQSGATGGGRRTRTCYRAAIQLFSGGKNAGRQTGALSHVVHACVQCSQCPPAFAALETFVALIMFLDSLLRSEH